MKQGKKNKVISIKEIARKANIRKPVIYRFIYTNKERYLMLKQRLFIYKQDLISFVKKFHKGAKK